MCNLTKGRAHACNSTVKHKAQVLKTVDSGHGRLLPSGYWGRGIAFPYQCFLVVSFDRFQDCSSFLRSSWFVRLSVENMADYNAQPPPSASKMNQVQEQVNDVKVILKDNINKVLERGERLDDLIDKTDDLQATADSFQKTSTRVARKYWWKNIKMMIIIGVVVAIIVILIILLATGVIPT
ncbi:vesicle-associated membrane protein 8 isoform X2 [Engraulis encrasicolus]|uniref:vesicle-associated membrane protein 8 isoform X2 n=1 Tax=Engraulis encrasicolus TaxID=184585 RepID=UPI002FD5B10C